MSTDAHDDAQILLDQLILPFYAIKRDMLIPTKNFTTENDAEHSWSVAVLACSLVEHIDPNLDTGLVCQYAIIHDLVELYAGDTSVWSDEEALKNKSTREKSSLKMIKKRFSYFTWLISTIEAYELQESNEARYVKAIDKYIALCVRFRDDGLFYKKMKISKPHFDKKLRANRLKAHSHRGVARYYELIREQYDLHPDHFYIQDTI